MAYKEVALESKGIDLVCALDRAGKQALGKFWYMPHNELQGVFHFKMSKNIHLQACGSIWCRTHCIPMGGTFSA